MNLTNPKLNSIWENRTDSKQDLDNYCRLKRKSFKNLYHVRVPSLQISHSRKTMFRGSRENIPRATLPQENR